VPEVNAALQQLLHVDYAQNSFLLVFSSAGVKLAPARRFAATRGRSSGVCFCENRTACGHTAQKILSHSGGARNKTPRREKRPFDNIEPLTKGQTIFIIDMEITK
jgi:hypothetical protein